MDKSCKNEPKGTRLLHKGAHDLKLLLSIKTETLLPLYRVNANIAQLLTNQCYNNKVEL